MIHSTELSSYSGEIIYLLLFTITYLCLYFMKDKDQYQSLFILMSVYNFQNRHSIISYTLHTQLFIL